MHNNHFVNILSTKLYIPRPRGNLVPRPRLLGKLDEAINQGCGLIILSAPAGSGKTTLLSEWLDTTRQATSIGVASIKQNNPPQFCWISLDEGDNDVVRFLSYLIAAIRTVVPNFGETPQSVLQSPQPAAMEALLTTLINELSTLPGTLVLVLDDYHLIHAQKVHAALTFLLEHRPWQFHLVIAARADPPLPVALLRGRGLVTEIRLGDLRFTSAEISSLMKLLLDRPLSNEDIQALVSRTEGWVAGLQMAAASMRESEDISGFIHAFSGSNRFILDYLVEQVLQQQPDVIQDFLFQTSILERMCAPLCEALVDCPPSTEDSHRFPHLIDSNLDHPAAQAILEYLERSNLFIVPLDDHRHWYRYHHLFTDLLGQRLLQSQPQRIAELHRRASRWFAENGFMAEAIHHALAGQDFEQAINLVEQAAEKTMMRSEVVTFLGWMEKLPESLVIDRPLLCINHAWALLMNGYPLEMIEARLACVENAPELMVTKALPLRAFLAVYRGENAQAIELAKLALAQLPEHDTFFRSLSAMTLGAANFSEGDETAGKQAMEMAARISQRTGNVMIQVSVLSYLAEFCRKRGQLHKAFTLYQQALERATDADGRKLPIAGRALMGLGDILREWNDLERAEDFITQGIDLSGQWGSVVTFSGYLSLARLHQGQKDWEKANEMLQKARQLALMSEITVIDDLAVELLQAWLWIVQGNWPAARQWARDHRLYEGVDTAEMESRDNFIAYHMRKYEFPVAGRLWLAEGRFTEAQTLLEGLLTNLEKWERPMLVIEAHLLLALVYHAQGKVEQATTRLETALRLAEPEGYMRIFLDEGESLHQLMQITVSTLKTEPLKSYAHRLLEAFSSTPGRSNDQKPSLKTGQLVEPLSERELEVLRLLASSLSTSEIAAELVVSVHTVRSHVKNIYAKLDVHNRYGAVGQAKEAKLI